MLAEDYPYNAIRGDCKYDLDSASNAKVSTYSYAEPGDINMIKKALSHSPIAAVINTSH